MPTVITHSFVSLALAPLSRRLGFPVFIIVLGAICCAIPDIDVIGFRLGVPYRSMFGHRGFTHSFLFAFLLAGFLTLVTWKWTRCQCKPLTVFLFIFLCTASHPLLDAMTDGGHGVALFSPFSNERIFFSWRPLKVSPFDVSRFLNGRANNVIFSELKWVVAPCVLLFIVTFRWSSPIKGNTRDFLRLVALGRSNEAHEKYAISGFKYHSAFVPDDRAPGREVILEIQSVLREKQRVVTFSRINRGTGEPDLAVVHAFRFKGTKIIEVWEVCQMTPENTVGNDAENIS